MFLTQRGRRCGEKSDEVKAAARVKSWRANELMTLEVGKSFEAVVSLVGTCALLTGGNGPPDSPSSDAAAAGTAFKTPGKRLRHRQRAP